MCFVTLCTWDRLPALTHPAVADLVSGTIMTTVAARNTEITAYCVMPDHIHLLLATEQPDTDMRVTIERAKQSAGFSHSRRFGGRLWQRSYCDYTLRPHEAVEPIVAYILNNPLRAGYVSQPEAWPYWGSSRWTRADLLETVAACGPGRRPG